MLFNLFNKIIFTELGYNNKSETENVFEPKIFEDGLEASLVYVSKLKFIQIKWSIKEGENICNKIDGFQIRLYLFNGKNDEVVLDAVSCNQR